MMKQMERLYDYRLNPVTVEEMSYAQLVRDQN